MTEGEWVKVKGERGLYRVKSITSKDGSVTLYGGDRDPRGHPGFRAVMPERLVAAKSPYGDRTATGVVG